MDTKRTEKLSSALYLLTSFFDDREPMKWRLRELAGMIVSPGDTNTSVLEVTSLLRIAKNAGLISDTNFDIIHGEFNRLLSPSQSFYDLFKREETIIPERTQEKPTNKAENRPIYISSSVTSRPTSQVAIKDKTRGEPGSVALKKNNRQTTIIGLIKRKKEIMIKDVSPLIPGVSEKTIQRELLSMVGAGILRKIGEKRWSRYTLAE